MIASFVANLILYIGVVLSYPFLVQLLAQYSLLIPPLPELIPWMDVCLGLIVVWLYLTKHCTQMSWLGCLSLCYLEQFLHAYFSACYSACRRTLDYIFRASITISQLNSRYSTNCRYVEDILIFWGDISFANGFSAIHNPNQPMANGERLLKVKAVIFDLDGTIVDFNLDYKASRAEIIQYLMEEGFPQSIFSVDDNLLEILNKVEIFLKNHHKERQIEKIKKSIFSIAEKYEMEAARKTRLIPGILEALKALREMKLKLALFTINGKNSVNHVLRTFNLKRYFDAAITRDDVMRVKPNPVHLKTALNTLRIKPKEAVVVGDSLWDMKSARALKVFAVGTTTGIASSQELTNAGAHCLVSSPTDIITLVEQLNKKGN